MNLDHLGWNAYFEALFATHIEAGWVPARVSKDFGETCELFTEHGVWSGSVSGKFRHETARREYWPAVGDWVAVQALAGEAKGVIHAVLQRKSAFIRKIAGEITEAQVVAANVDTVFIVTGLDHNYNLRRIERYLTLAWDSSASPVVLLNKADLCEDVAEKVAEVESVATGTPVHALSALQHENLDVLRTYLGEGKTSVFLGSSGVGKSTLVNALTGAERMAVADVRAQDSRGRHTTTHRELILLPGGGILIDTPGMRELQLWGDEDAVARSFPEIDKLAQDCRFRDCTHDNEPGCNVQRAVESGELDAHRFESFRKQQKELQYLARRQDHHLQQQEKAKWKAIHKSLKHHPKYK